eukprot:1251462-Pleurochrysis_carterae.AAC.1
MIRHVVARYGDASTYMAFLDVDEFVLARRRTQPHTTAHGCGPLLQTDSRHLKSSALHPILILVPVVVGGCTESLSLLLQRRPVGGQAATVERSRLAREYARARAECSTCFEHMTY